MDRETRRGCRQGEPSVALIGYADFTDYERIVCRGDNWRTVFEPIFGGRKESVQESFFRIGPARNTTMHSRIITLDDEMFLHVEIKRMLRAISKTER